jgi:LPXTG-motif cell wall-anchored protein
VILADVAPPTPDPTNLGLIVVGLVVIVLAAGGLIFLRRRKR